MKVGGDSCLLLYSASHAIMGPAMATNLILIAILLFFAPEQTTAQALPKFMGRTMTIIRPEHDGGQQGIPFPKGPATVCLEGPPRRQCYTSSKEFGNDAQVSVIHLRKDVDAILFSAATGGISGFGIHFALLRACSLRLASFYHLWICLEAPADARLSDVLPR